VHCRDGHRDVDRKIFVGMECGWGEFKGVERDEEKPRDVVGMGKVYVDADGDNFLYHVTL